MHGLKEQIALDRDIFINTDEFAEVHRINNRSLAIVIDDDRLSERTSKEFSGVSIGELLYFVKASEYGEKPSIGEAQKFDKRQMYVVDVKESDGMYEIILSQNLG